jgi:hypothetical protein
MRFHDAMLIAANELTADGWIVLMPFVNKGNGRVNAIMLDVMHLSKISMSERVIVITDFTGYIGESTRNEMRYAEERGIEVITRYMKG